MSFPHVSHDLSEVVESQMGDGFEELAYLQSGTTAPESPPILAQTREEIGSKVKVSCNKFVGSD